MRAIKKITSIIFALLFTLILLGECAYASYPGDYFELYRTADSYNGKQSTEAGQCKGFIRLVFREALGISVPSTQSNDWSRWEDNGEFMEVGHVTLDSPSLAINASKLKSLMALASPGDAIQMDIHKDTSNPSCHSMLFLGYEDGGIAVYHSNWKPNNYVSKDIFALMDMIDYIGSGGGITVYRPK
ncbi:MAG TPA: hypothetical protein PKU80_06340 [Candidatus Limiplasma sp.]|nr:hypothetical protein [Candidatus Limiplasma sp.]